MTETLNSLQILQNIFSVKEIIEIYISNFFNAFYNFCTFYGRLLKLINIALSVIVTFAVCFFPFLLRKEDALQILHRLFPFARGLYEVSAIN